MQADEVVITAIPDLANLRNAKNIVDLLKHGAQERQRAASRDQHGEHAEAPGDHVEGIRAGARHQGHRVIEFDSETFGQAANNGQMIEELNAKAKSAPALPRHRDGHRSPARHEGRQEVASSALRPVPRETEAQALRRATDVRQAYRTIPVSTAPRGPPPPAAAPQARRRRSRERKPRAATAPARAGAGAAHEPQRRHSEEYYDVKTTVFNALIDTIDLTQLAKLDVAAAREEIRDIVSEIIQIKNVVMSIAEQEELLEDICNDVLGYGPLEPLLARDDIADIMVNGADTTFIEVAGKVQKTGVRFADNLQLMNICQRIVSQVGRRVDESSPDLRRAPARRLAASTSSRRRWPSTAPRSPFVSSRRIA